MSLVPIGASVVDGLKNGRGRSEDSLNIKARYGQSIQFSQFEGAEIVAETYNVTRDEIDSFAAASHAKAWSATKR
ncbi:hypothetical protein HDU93_006560, partial [Gonapodya sp. JEL0774]